MQEFNSKKIPSTWTSAISWAASKAINIASGIFDLSKPIFSLTFLGQLSEAAAQSYCYLTPGATQPNIVVCENYGLEALSYKLISANCSIIPVSDENCCLIDSCQGIYTFTKSYGSSVFGSSLCDVSYNLKNLITSCVDQALTNGLTARVFTSDDSAAVAMIALGSAAIMSLTLFFVIRRCGKNSGVTEESPLMKEALPNNAAVREV